MKTVIKAILLDNDVVDGLSINISQTGPVEWSVAVGDGGTDDSKLVEPMVYYASFIRKMNGVPDYSNRSIHVG